MYNDRKMKNERNEQKMTSWTEWKLNDLIYGIILPVIVAFLIIIFPFELSKIFAELDPSLTLNAILIDGLAEAILTIAIPLFAGLIWNQWAGGAAGFLLGSIYALFVNDVYAANAAFMATMGDFSGFSIMGMIGGISILGYVVGAMLVGYISGALNRGSFSFRRMVVCALIAAFIAGFFQLWSGILEGSMIQPTLDSILESSFYIFLPKVVYAIIIPIFVTLFGWFGISPKQMM